MAISRGENRGNGMLTFRSALCTVRLHCNVRVQVVQSAVGFLAALPAALVHALNLFIPSSRSLVLLCARDRYETINRADWVTALQRRVNYASNHVRFNV